MRLSVVPHGSLLKSHLLVLFKSHVEVLFKQHNRMLFASYPAGKQNALAFVSDQGVGIEVEL